MPQEALSPFVFFSTALCFMDCVLLSSGALDQKFIFLDSGSILCNALIYSHNLIRKVLKNGVYRRCSTQECVRGIFIFLRLLP